MKKFLLPALMILLTPTISGCSDEAHGVVQIKSFNNSIQFVELSASQLVNLLESGQECILEEYTTTCGHCEDLEPLLLKYSKASGNIIYRIDGTKIIKKSDEDESIIDKYPNVFIDRYVPHLYFVKDKTLTYEVPNEKLFSYNTLSSLAKKHVVESNITFINNYETFEAYTNKTKNYIAINYDLDDPASIKAAYDYLVNKEVGRKRKNIILLNKASFAADFAKIIDFYNVSEHPSFCSLVKNGEITKTIDYLTDGSKIPEILSTL